MGSSDVSATLSFWFYSSECNSFTFQVVKPQQGSYHPDDGEGKSAEMLPKPLQGRKGKM